MKLFFIRHGQTEWNVKGKIQGSYDSELNETGITQAYELCKKVLASDYKFSKIYTSKQKRAFKTAQILSEAINVECIPMLGLEEINLGEWEGLTWTEVQERYPREFEDWRINLRYTKSPKGESYHDMTERSLAAIEKIINESNNDVAIVTHSAVIMCLQCYITNTPFDEMLKFKADNTAITEIDSELLIQLQ